MIKRQIEENKFDRVRKFEFTLHSVDVYATTSKRARQLLKDIIAKVRSGCDLESLVVTGTYKDFRYDYAPHFTKDRKELVTNGFIIMDKQEMFVNPVMINYLSRRQVDWLEAYFKLKKIIPVHLSKHHVN